MRCLRQSFCLAVLCLGPGIWNALATATTLPILTNVWEQAHILIIDKDTNSVFLNANETFLATLRPSFPDIKTVTNQRAWNEVVPSSSELQVYARANGSPFAPVTGAAAQTAAANYLQTAAWTLFDAGLAKLSPTVAGLPRP